LSNKQYKSKLEMKALLILTFIFSINTSAIAQIKIPKINVPTLPKGTKIPGTTTGQNSSGTRPSDNLMADGLKSALEVGFGKAADKVGLIDGFFGNAMIKILMPKEAKQVESTLRAMGMNKACDDAILSINRAAEGAAKEAKPIFLSAIKQLTITDAVNIVTGSDDAATQFLRRTVGESLKTKFQPVIKTNLEKVNATKYWSTIFTTYNSIPFKQEKINPNLEEYVTNKAIDGIFMVLAEEEKKIRKDPINRTTQIIKDIFGWADKNRK
jgi:hypothetical protein